MFADKLNHASLIDAMQLAKANGADVQRYPQNDMAALEKMLAASPAANKLIVSDAVACRATSILAGLFRKVLVIRSISGAIVAL